MNLLFRTSLWTVCILIAGCKTAGGSSDAGLAGAKSSSGPKAGSVLMLRQHFSTAKVTDIAELTCDAPSNGETMCVQKIDDNSPNRTYYSITISGSTGTVRTHYAPPRVPDVLGKMTCTNDTKYTCTQNRGPDQMTYYSVVAE